MNAPRPFQFFHERLDVYHTAIEFIVQVKKLIVDVPRGNGEWVDQLRRASMSIALNIAEGACERAGNEKRRMYLIALRSANECAATIEVFCRAGIWDDIAVRAARDELVRTTAMLSRLCAVVRSRVDADQRGNHAVAAAQGPRAADAPLK